MAEERRVELLSHNLSNVNTKGFKQFRIALESVQGAKAADEISFAMPTQVQSDLRSGPIVSTGNPLDVMLTDGVHMEVQANDKVGYLRSATLMMRPDGAVITDEGDAVMGKNGLTN